MSEAQKSACPVSSGPRICLTRRAFLLLLTSPAFTQALPRNEIRFDLVNGVPIVPAIVNGNKARLVIDTGSTPSLFAWTLIGDTQIETNFVHATTPNGDLFLKVGTAAVTIGTLSIKLSKVFVDAKQLVSGKADGLLGNDFWAAAGGVSLDYKRQTLTIGAAL